MRLTRSLVASARILLASTTTGIAAASAQGGDLAWRQFSDRFGTRVDYPAAIFSRIQESEGGVALVRADDRARLRVFVLENARRDTPRSFLRREFPFERSALTYDRVTPRFFVVSARRNDRIVYTRCNFAQRIHCIELIYPQPEKRPFDPVTTRISLSLRPRG